MVAKPTVMVMIVVLSVMFARARARSRAGGVLFILHVGYCRVKGNKATHSIFPGNYLV